MALIPILGRIQEIETRLQSLAKRAALLQHNPDEAALLAVLKDREQVATRLTASLEEDRKRQRQLELEVQDCVDHRKAVEAKLYDGTVVSSRELEQLQQKVAEYKTTLNAFEEEELQLMEAEESLARDLEAVQRELVAENEKVTGLRKQLAIELGEVRIEEGQLGAELAELLPQISSEWVERYRRVAQSHNGVGIARIKGTTCGACHVEQSDAMMQKIKRGEDQLLSCESCGRIIYY
jgi:predicted  nucleic acid-binding Zn-ribbon protein